MRQIVGRRITTKFGYHSGPLLVWTLCCGLFFATILAGWAHLPTSDFSEQFHTFAAFQARELLAGRLPVWSPGSYGGIPFAADPQAGVFYLPRWLTILLSAPWQLPYYALELEAIAHVWLAGSFTYGLGFAITRHRWAALVGGVAFGLSGWLTSYPLLQLALLETITWVPLLLLLLRLAVERARPAPYLGGAGIVLALSLSAGHPQTALHIAYLAGAYYLFLCWRVGWPWRWRLAGGAVVAGAALGVAAAVWLPAVHFVSYTTRNNVDYSFVSAGQPLLNYVQSLAPGVLSHWSPEYIGLAVLILAIFAWLAREEGDRAEIIFWLSAALIAAWLALGDRGLLFRLAYRLAPGFSLFRQQERLLGVASLSTALLAAQGAALWLQMGPVRRRRILARTVLGAGGALIVVGVILAGTSAIHTRAWFPIWSRALLLFVLIVGLLWGGRRPQLRLFGLVLLLAVDLYVGTYPSMDRQPGSPAVYWPEPTWTTFLASDTPVRIDSQGIFNANIGELHGWEDVRGISPLKPALLERVEALPRPLRWQLLNVTHVMTWPDALQEEPLRPVADIDGGLVPDRPLQAVLYHFEAPLPRAWMVYDALVVPDAEAAYQTLAEAHFDPGRTAILHPPLPAVESWIAPPGPPTVVTVRHQPNTLEVRVSTAVDGLLVISEWLYPGWRATVDGEPAPLSPANYAFMAIPVPAGEHTVELSFVPLDVLAGILLSLISLAGVAVIAWRWQPAIPRFAVPRMNPPRPRWRRGWQAFPPVAERPFAVVLLLIAFALRMYTISGQELRGDEAFSARFASRSLMEIVTRLLAVGEPHSPFHFWSLHLWMQLTGQSELALRALSVLLGMLLLAVAYQVARHLGGRRLGRLMLPLMVVSPLLIWISQDVRNMYNWAPLLALATTLVLLKATGTRRRGRQRRIWLAYAILAALTIYSHFYGVFVLIGHGFYLLYAPGRRRRLPAWLLSAGIGGLLFLPWPLLLWPQLVAAGHLASPDTPDLAQHIVRLGRELTVGDAYDRPSGRWLFLGTALIAAVGAHRLGHRRPGWGAFLLAWLGSTVLFLYLVRYHHAAFNFYYIIVAVPAWWLLFSAGLLSLWSSRQPWRQLIAVAGVVLIVGSSLLTLKNYYFVPLYNRTLGYRPIAEQIRHVGGQDELFVSNAPDPSLNYYLEDVTVHQTTWPSRWAEPPAETETGLAAQVNGYDRVWLVPAAGSGWDPDGVVYNWLEYNTLLEYALEYEKLSLRAYRPLHAVDQVLEPVGATMTNGAGLPVLRLEGFYVMVDGRPAASGPAPLILSPGATVQVTLLWQALADIEEDYTVFVHLLDARGAPLISQHDGVPFFGLRHTSTWQPGDRILDRHTFQVPEQLEGQPAVLLAGLYQSETLARQPFADGREAIPLREVVWQR